MFSIRIFFLSLLLILSLNASVGKVSLLKGEVFALRNGQVITLQTGSQVEEKDTISTGKNAQIQLIFEDKTVITLGNNSIFKIEEYLNQEQQPKAKFSFAKGTFKTITGKIGKRAPENFTLETKTATIGIRGTIIRGKIDINQDIIMCESGVIKVRSRITGQEVLIHTGQVIILPHDAPPLPIRNMNPLDLDTLSFHNDRTFTENPTVGTGEPIPLSENDVQSYIDTVAPSDPFFSQPQNFTPEAANTALETSFRTQQQDAVIEEILSQECPSGTTGTYPNCIALTCPSGTTGTYPNCVALTCPSGTTGTYPNCVALTCPSGTTGTYPNCVALTCPSGTTGTYPNCVALTCPSGTTGTYPNCVALTCPSGTTGTYPNCVALTCPSGTTGTYPNCVIIDDPTQGGY